MNLKLPVYYINVSRVIEMEVHEFNPFFATTKNYTTHMTLIYVDVWFKVLFIFLYTPVKSYVEKWPQEK